MQLQCVTSVRKSVFTLCCAAEYNKMWPCHAANGENNVDINVARFRQGFYTPCHTMWHENSMGKMSVSWRVCHAAYDEYGVSKLHHLVRVKKSDAVHWSHSRVFWNQKSVPVYVRIFLIVRIILKNWHTYGLFSKIGTWTDYYQKSVHVQIILNNLWGLIYKCLFGGPHM